MESARLNLTFVDPGDDTAENRVIVALAEERSQEPRANDRDVDQLIDDLGFDPAEFVAR